MTLVTKSVLGFLSRSLAKAYLYSLDMRGLLIHTSDNYDKKSCFGVEEELEIAGDHFTVEGGGIPPWESIFRTKTSFPKPCYTVHYDACLVGVNAIAVNNQGKVLLESTLNSKGYLLKSGDLKYLRDGQKARRSEAPVIFSMVNVLSKAYYHWVVEVLPILEAYFHFISIEEIKPKILVNSSPAQFQFEFLEAFGVDRADILIWDRNPIQIERLVLASPRYARVPKDGVWARHFYSRNGLRWVRNSILSQLDVKTDRRRKIYVKRKTDRRVVNDEELGALLKSLGFESLYLEERTVLEQIIIFRQSEQILAVHGAALANTLFGSSMTIFELFPSDRDIYQAYYYYQISAIFHYDHQFIYCQTANSNQDIQVDVELLKEKLLGRQSRKPAQNHKG